MPNPKEAEDDPSSKEEHVNAEDDVVQDDSASLGFSEGLGFRV